MHARSSLPKPALVLVTDSTRAHPQGVKGSRTLDDIVRDAVLGGVNVVQLREKHLSTVALIELGLHVRGAIAGRALLFVNGDIEATRALAADGIHLPADGPTVSQVRRELGDDLLVSVAVHNLEEAKRAEGEGADMLQLGTVFATNSKPGVRPLGVEGLRAVCDVVGVPVIAIGGITPATAGDALDAGAQGIAVIGAIFDAPDARIAAADLCQAMGQPAGRRS